MAYSPPRPASAASLEAPAGVRDCINTDYPGCEPWGSLAAGTHVSMVCWQSGSLPKGGDSRKWFYVFTATGVQGLVYSSRVEDRTAVPHCSSHRGISAGRWAAQHVGKAKLTDKERDILGIRYWSGSCPKFVSAAYQLGVGVTPRISGDANVRYYQYSAAGVVESGPPRHVGSLVFWPNVTQWGHVAMYMGNGMVVTTRGVPGDKLVILRVPVSTFGTPTGWIHPDSVPG